MLETETGLLDRPPDSTTDNNHGSETKTQMVQAKNTGRWVTVTGEIAIGREIHLIGFSYHTRESLGPDCSRAKQQFLLQFRGLVPSATLRDVEARTTRKEPAGNRRHGFFPLEDRNTEDYEPQG